MLSFIIKYIPSGLCHKNNYNFQYITLNEGLSHADANTIIKDNKGFLWIGTYSGLNRFDGIHINPIITT